MAKIHPYNVIVVKPINKENCFKCNKEVNLKKCSYCSKKYCSNCIELNCCIYCKDVIVQVKTATIFTKLFK